MKLKGRAILPTDQREKVILVAAQFADVSDRTVERSLEELARLVETLGGQIAGSVVQRRQKLDPATYIGLGKAHEIAEQILAEDIALAVFDTELSGTQQKNLEKHLHCRVIDRTGIILDIFSRHARTKEAKDQVELASLEYLSTHLTRRWTHLERQKGGIGLRGVGERQIEIDRRLIRSRIAKLKRELAKTAKERATQRMHRDKFLRVSLVGYTNAGKSTLMNGLTRAQVYVDDRLFATLDSTVRVIDPKTRPAILLSDTVGFIDKLPHGLIASFRSTLQEVLEADLLLHVVDLSSDDYRNQVEVTRRVLDEIGAADKPSLLVFNKADLLQEVFLPKILERRYIDSFVVSALRPHDMTRLRNGIFDFFEKGMIEMEVVVPYQNSWLQSQIHENAKVLSKDYMEDGAKYRIRIMRSAASRLKLSDTVAVER